MIHAYIYGFVQGIGFRQFVKRNARKLNLRGWVRNLPDGRVEVVFEGEAPALEKMIGLCRRGPFLSEVKNVEVDWNYKEPLDIIGFEIIK